MPDSKKKITTRTITNSRSRTYIYWAAQRKPFFNSNQTTTTTTAEKETQEVSFSFLVVSFLFWFFSFVSYVIISFSWNFLIASTHIRIYVYLFIYLFSLFIFFLSVACSVAIGCIYGFGRIVQIVYDWLAFIYSLCSMHDSAFYNLYDDDKTKTKKQTNKWAYKCDEKWYGNVRDMGKILLEKKEHQKHIDRFSFSHTHTTVDRIRNRVSSVICMHLFYSIEKP